MFFFHWPIFKIFPQSNSELFFFYFCMFKQKINYYFFEKIVILFSWTRIAYLFYIIHYNFFKIMNLLCTKIHYYIYRKQRVYKCKELFSYVPFVCDVRSCIWNVSLISLCITRVKNNNKQLNCYSGKIMYEEINYCNYNILIVVDKLISIVFLVLSE